MMVEASEASCNWTHQLAHRKESGLQVVAGLIYTD